MNAVLSPVGHPLHAIDGGQRLLAEIVVIDVDEPLIHAAENHRRLAAPTVRVAVRIFFLMHQRGLCAKQLQHGLVGLTLAILFEDGFAEQIGGHLLGHRQVVGVGKLAVVIHGAIDWQAVGAAEMIVIHAVPGRDVHEAGARAVLHKVITGKKIGRFVDEGMAILERADCLAGERFDFLGALPAARLGHLWQQRALDDIHLAIDAHFFVGEP